MIISAMLLSAGFAAQPPGPWPRKTRDLVIVGCTAKFVQSGMSADQLKGIAAICGCQADGLEKVMNAGQMSALMRMDGNELDGNPLLEKSVKITEDCARQLLGN